MQAAKACRASLFGGPVNLVVPRTLSVAAFPVIPTGLAGNSRTQASPQSEASQNLIGNKMDISQSKLKAKVLATYLREIGSPIKHGQALDALARINGHRSWNEFSAAPASVAPLPAAAPVHSLPVLSVWAGQRDTFRASARIRSDDNRMKATFDVTTWLDQASDDDLSQLVEIGFGGDYVSDAAGEFMGARDSDVAAVFKYIERAQEFLGPRDSLGFEVDVDPEGVWAYLRAFRYGLYVRLTLGQHFGHIQRVDSDLVVTRLSTEPASFVITTPGVEKTSFAEEDFAWTEVGKALEATIAAERNITMEALEVSAWSGIREGCVPARVEAPLPPAGRYVEEGGKHLVLAGSAPLAHGELRRITGDGEHMLDIVLGVELEDIASGIDALNDHVSERIAGSLCDLTGLCYLGYAGADAAELAQSFGAIIRVRAYWTPADGIQDDSEG
jgi:hypothetical protein